MYSWRFSISHKTLIKTRYDGSCLKWRFLRSVSAQPRVESWFVILSPDISVIPRICSMRSRMFVNSFTKGSAYTGWGHILVLKVSYSFNQMLFCLLALAIVSVASQCTTFTVSPGTGCQWMCQYCANTLGTNNYYFNPPVCTWQSSGCVGNPQTGVQYTCCVASDLWGAFSIYWDYTCYECQCPLDIWCFIRVPEVTKFVRDLTTWGYLNPFSVEMNNWVYKAASQKVRRVCLSCYYYPQRVDIRKREIGQKQKRFKTLSKTFDEVKEYFTRFQEFRERKDLEICIVDWHKRRNIKGLLLFRHIFWNGPFFNEMSRVQVPQEIKNL